MDAATVVATAFLPIAFGAQRCRLSLRPEFGRYALSCKAIVAKRTSEEPAVDTRLYILIWIGSGPVYHFHGRHRGRIGR